MKTNEKEVVSSINLFEKTNAEDLSKQCWNYVKTVVDIVREPILILDKNLCVMAANDSFYRMFQVEQKDTEGRIVYELGNGQWNIPALKKLLEDILPKNTFFKGFEVSHDFQFIGRKEMLLNARQIHFSEDKNIVPELFPSIIFLAIEDVTNMMVVAETLAVHVKELAQKNAAETKNEQNFSHCK